MNKTINILSFLGCLIKKTIILSLLVISQKQLISQTYDVPCTADAYVFYGTGGDCDQRVYMNYGNEIELHVSRWTWNNAPHYCTGWGKQRVVLKFDLNIQSHQKRLYDNRAFMYLYYAYTNGSIPWKQQFGANLFYIERITENWSEMTVNWNNQPQSTNVNSITVPASTSLYQDYVIDMSTIVYQWVCDSFPNYGMKLLLLNESANSYANVCFYSKESPDSNKHPKLRLEYAEIEATYTYCTGGVFLNLNTILTNALNPAVYSFSWQHLNSGNTHNGQQWDDPPFYTGVINTYVVTVSNPWCQTATDTIILNNPGGFIPTSDFTVTSPVCVGDTVTITYTGNAAPGDAYLWHFAGGQVITGTGQGPFQVLWQSEGTYNVSLTVITDSCTSATTVIPVVVSTDIDVNIMASTPVCEGEDILLYITGGAQYQWSGPDGFSSNLPNPVISDATLAGNGMYYVTVTSGICTANDSVYVIVNPNPTANAGTDQTIVEGESILLMGSGGQNYSWHPNTYLSASNIANPIATPPVTITYILTVSNIYGCSDNDTIVVTVETFSSQIFIPNIFSPNNDGVNDVLYVYGEGIKNMKFFIYNRWGKKVFESFNQANGWDGTYKGQASQIGVYYYYLEAELWDNEIVAKKGNITLIR